MFVIWTTSVAFVAKWVNQIFATFVTKGGEQNICKPLYKKRFCTKRGELNICSRCSKRDEPNDNICSLFLSSCYFHIFSNKKLDFQYYFHIFFNAVFIFSAKKNLIFSILMKFRAKCTTNMIFSTIFIYSAIKNLIFSNLLKFPAKYTRNMIQQHLTRILHNKNYLQPYFRISNNKFKQQ